MSTSATNRHHNQTQHCKYQSAKTTWCHRRYRGLPTTWSQQRFECTEHRRGEADLTQARRRVGHPHPLLTRTIPSSALANIRPSYKVVLEYGLSLPWWTRVRRCLQRPKCRVGPHGGRIPYHVGGVLVVNIGNWLLWRFRRAIWRRRRENTSRIWSNWKERNVWVLRTRRVSGWWMLRPPSLDLHQHSPLTLGCLYFNFK